MIASTTSTDDQFLCVALLRSLSYTHISMFGVGCNEILQIREHSVVVASHYPYPAAILTSKDWSCRGQRRRRRSSKEDNRRASLQRTVVSQRRGLLLGVLHNLAHSMVRVVLENEKGHPDEVLLVKNALHCRADAACYCYCRHFESESYNIA